MLSVLPTRIQALVPRGRFARRLAMLSSSFAAGQVLIVASMPILTRLNSPEDFGAYAVFTSLVGILGNVVCLRFEYGVPVGRNEKESARLMQLSILCCVGFSVLAVPAVYLGGDWLARVSDIPELAELLWLLPLSVIGLGSSQALSFWSVLRGTFRLNALSRVGQSLAQAVFQVDDYENFVHIQSEAALRQTPPIRFRAAGRTGMCCMIASAGRDSPPTG